MGARNRGPQPRLSRASAPRWCSSIASTLRKKAIWCSSASKARTSCGRWSAESSACSSKSGGAASSRRPPRHFSPSRRRPRRVYPRPRRDCFSSRSTTSSTGEPPHSVRPHRSDRQTTALSRRHKDPRRSRILFRGTSCSFVPSCLRDECDVSFSLRGPGRSELHTERQSHHLRVTCGPSLDPVRLEIPIVDAPPGRGKPRAGLTFNPRDNRTQILARPALEPRAQLRALTAAHRQNHLAVQEQPATVLFRLQATEACQPPDEVGFAFVAIPGEVAPLVRDHERPLEGQKIAHDQP